MSDLRRRRLDSAVWIPLRAVSTIEKSGEYATAGYREEFFGAASIVVPIDQRDLADGLGWTDVGIMHDHEPYVDQGRYVPADTAIQSNGLEAVRLVIAQRGNTAENSEWHLHQDFVVGLFLKREADSWLAIDEGYEIVARLHRSPLGSPILLEARAEYLKDYLAARSAALYVNLYRNRVEVLPDASHISWERPSTEARENHDRWQGRVDDIHEGGMPFGATTAVFHVRRTDVDQAEDVPTLGQPNDANVESSSWTKEDGGAKLHRISGELWRSEWVEPGQSSPRIRRDEVVSHVSFIVDPSGARCPADELKEGGRWLWFRPEVIPTLAHRRGGNLSWYTKDTGSVACSPDYAVHFGVNDLGLVTVYAKDVARLPEWQKRVWAGANVTPEGGVSRELLASQVDAEPAETLAPEDWLERALGAVEDAVKRTFGVLIFRHNDQRTEILQKAHRFRATEIAGLCALAKDVARLTADSIDAGALQTIVPPPKGEKWGSLKSLENVVARCSTPAIARRLMAPLVGAYDLRQSDAHLATSQIDDALRLLDVDRTKPFVEQGRMLLHACVSALFTIAEVLNKHKCEPA